MKKSVLILTLALIGLSSTFAQVGVGTTTPDASAILELKSSEKGFLPPRMDTAQRNALTSPATGLMIYNTTEKCLQVNVGRPDSIAWQCFAGGDAGNSDGASGAIEGNYWQASNLRFTEFGITNHPSNEYYSWGITTDGTCTCGVETRPCKMH